MEAAFGAATSGMRECVEVVVELPTLASEAFVNLPPHDKITSAMNFLSSSLQQVG